MANISSANGTITIEIAGRDEKKLLNDFKRYIDLALANDNVCYSTVLDPVNFEIGEGGDEEIGNKFYAEDTFYGAGRWVYETNIELCYKWLEASKDDNEETKKLWAELNKHNWRLTFDFVDEEGGNQVLYEAVAEVIHKANEDKAEVNFCSREDYDYTPENLVDLGVYETLEGAQEACGIE